MTIDDVNKAVRDLVRAVMGMPAGSVRPANQLAPAGKQTQEIATVHVVDSQDVGWPADTQEDNLLADTSTASVDTLENVTVSIQFFRSASKDAVGLAKRSTSAFDRARTLGRRLQLPSGVEAMNAAGLGLIRVGKARDLAALVDANWESRGQVDITFNVAHRESESVQNVLSSDFDLKFKPPGDAPMQTRTIEVTP